MKTPYEVIRRPISTEKTMQQGEESNKYVFEVALDANKPTIRHAIQTIFSVDVTSVNTAIMQGKRKRFGRTVGKRSTWKKATVTLAEGDAIDFYGEDEEL